MQNSGQVKNETAMWPWRKQAVNTAQPTSETDASNKGEVRPRQRVRRRRAQMGRSESWGLKGMFLVAAPVALALALALAEVGLGQEFSPKPMQTPGGPVEEKIPNAQ